VEIPVIQFVGFSLLKPPTDRVCGAAGPRSVIRDRRLKDEIITTSVQWEQTLEPRRCDDDRNSTSRIATNIRDFTRSVLDAGLLEHGSAVGVYHRSFEFEKIIRGIESCISSAGGNEKRRQMFCSPVMARTTLAKCGFLTSFPDLVGTISSFAGSDCRSSRCCGNEY
jgi:hypothetical protein